MGFCVVYVLLIVWWFCFTYAKLEVPPPLITLDVV